MRTFTYLAFSLLLITAFQCKTPKGNSASTAQLTATNNTMLQQTWLHSREEDEGDVQVYRPNSYNFPPSRGRTGFAFEAGGKFIQYNIAPTDGLVGVPGRWEMKDKTLNITFPSGQEQPYQLEVVSMEKDMLKVRRK